MSILFSSTSFSQTDWLSKEMVEQFSAPLEVTEGDYFGSAVDISDKYAIVGSKEDDVTGIKSGSVYIFEKKELNWEFVQKFINDDDSSSNNYMGHSVAIYNDFAFAGASQYDLNEENKDVGKVYVLKRQETGVWIKYQTLLPEPVFGTHRFGSSIAVHDGILVIGASGNREETGKVFVFHLDEDQWIQEQCLEPEYKYEDAKFGCDVDVFSEFIIVGAYFENYENGNKGSAYIFKKIDNTWKQVEQLIPSIEQKYLRYGYSVCINHKYAIVSSYKENSGEVTKPGVVYLYKRNENEWKFLFKLTEDNLESGDKYGISLHLEDNLLMVGATRVETDADDSGAVFFYELEDINCTKIKKISALNPKSYANFGTSVAFSGSNIIVGAETMTNNEIKTGSVYFYTPKALTIPTSPPGVSDVLNLMKRISQKQ